MGTTNVAGDLATDADTECDRPAMGNVILCTDTCRGPQGQNWARDGRCDDGGPNADFDACPLGTDCTDCGEREGNMVLGCGDGPACEAPNVCDNGQCVCFPDWQKVANAAMMVVVEHVATVL